MVTWQADKEKTSLTQRRGHRRPNWAAMLAFVGGVALVLLYALRGGGSYDTVTFQENGLVIWWLLAIGIGLGVLPRTRPARAVMLLVAALVAYAAWTATSLLWTDSSELTGFEVARVLDYVGLVALVGCALERDTWRPAAAGLGAGALVVCAVAVGTRLAPAVFGTDHVDAVLHIDRLSVPFGYWNAVGAWGAMTATIGLAWSAHDASRSRRALALAAVPVAALTTYLTYSRAGIAGTAVGVVLVLLLSQNRITMLIHTLVAAAGTTLAILAVRAAPAIADGTGTAGAPTVFGALLLAVAICIVASLLTAIGATDRRRAPRRTARLLSAFGLVVAVAGAAAFGPGLASRASHSFTQVPTAQAGANPTGRLTNLSGTRYPLWKVMFKAFEEHPVEGLGAGTTEFWWNEHATNAEFVRNTHSIWLENLAELGVPGLLLIVIVAATALGVGIAARRRVKRSASIGAASAFVAALIVYLLQASVDWMWQSTALTVLALAGTAVLGVRLGAGRPRLRAPLRAVLVLAALAAGGAQLPGLLGTSALRRSQSAERLGQTGVARGWAQAAIDAQPWSASAYDQLGLVLESTGRLRPAAAALQRAIAREPQNYVHWLVLARIETERGQLRAAVADYERARQLRRQAPVFRAAAAAAG